MAISEPCPAGGACVVCGTDIPPGGRVYHRAPIRNLPCCSVACVAATCVGRPGSWVTPAGILVEATAGEIELTEGTLDAGTGVVRPRVPGHWVVQGARLMQDTLATATFSRREDAADAVLAWGGHVVFVRDGGQ